VHFLPVTSPKVSVVLCLASDFIYGSVGHSNVVVVLVVGAYQHCSHEGLLYSYPPMEFRHSSPEALHTKRCERPLLAKDVTKAKEFN
jgi:hypothetical protein